MFVEATIYQMDEENEALCEAMTQASSSDTGAPEHILQGQQRPVLQHSGVSFCRGAEYTSGCGALPHPGFQDVA